MRKTVSWNENRLGVMAAMVIGALLSPVLGQSAPPDPDVIRVPSPTRRTQVSSDFPPPGLNPARVFRIPEGTPIEVRLTESLSTKSALAGDHFEAVLNRAIVSEGQDVLPKGTLIRGRVVESEAGGRVKGRSALTLTLEAVELEAEAIPIRTSEFSLEAARDTGKDAATVGVGAGLGAVIGAIFGGKKGAAIGAAIGAGSGTAKVLTSKGKDVVLDSERLLSFRLEEEVRISRR